MVSGWSSCLGPGLIVDDPQTGGFDALPFGWRLADVWVLEQFELCSGRLSASHDRPALTPACRPSRHRSIGAGWSVITFTASSLDSNSATTANRYPPTTNFTVSLGPRSAESNAL
jgi:hypothetical protein